MTKDTITVGQVRQILAPYAAVMKAFATEMQEKLTTVDVMRNQERSGARPDNSAIMEALADIFHEYTTLDPMKRRYTKRKAPFNNLMTDWSHMSRPEFAKLTLVDGGFHYAEIEPGLVKKWDNALVSLSDDSPAPARMGIGLSLYLPPRKHAVGRWKSDMSQLNVVFDSDKQKTLIQCGYSNYSIRREFELAKEDDLKEVLKSWLLRYGREYSKDMDITTDAQIVWNLRPHPEDYDYISHGQESGGPKASYC